MKKFYITFHTPIGTFVEVMESEARFSATMSFLTETSNPHEYQFVGYHRDTPMKIETFHLRRNVLANTVISHTHE